MDEIVRIEEYPIPFNQDEIISIQEEMIGESYIEIDSIIKNVDEFHEKYIHELHRTDDWSVFECGWPPNEGWVYFWEHQSGHGFKVDYSWEVMCSFVDLMDSFSEEFDSSDFEPKHYPWEIP